MTTDTPRTDACPHPKPKLMRLGAHWKWCSDCGSAQRVVELKPFGSWQVPTNERAEKAEAEVEFWKAKAHEAEFYEGKHEAEVERLRGSLRDQERSLGTSQFYLARAIEIAEIVGWTQNVAYLSELRAELDELKTTLNPTTEDSSEPQL